MCVGVEGGARVGVDGKALYDVSVGVGVEGGAVAVVSDLLKKDFTDNCLCKLMVLVTGLVNSDWSIELIYNDFGINPSHYSTLK